MTLQQIKDFNTKIDNHLYDQGIITEGFYLKQAEKLYKRLLKSSNQNLITTTTQPLSLVLEITLKPKS